MGSYHDLDKKISSGSSVLTGLPGTLKPPGLSVIYACRYGKLELLSRLDIACTAAVRAFLPDDLSGTPAVRTCGDRLYLSEEG